MKLISSFITYLKKLLIFISPPSPATSNPGLCKLCQVLDIGQENSLETCLALGNLFRTQGNIEKAIKSRKELLKTELDDKALAKVWVELAGDYKQGGMLDRAQKAYEKALALAGDKKHILLALAVLAAAGKDYKKAAAYYAKLSHNTAQAHYLVQLARQKSPKAAQRLLQRSLDIYPGCVEAWLEKIIYDYEKQDWQGLKKHLRLARRNIPAHLYFLGVEGLIQHLAEQQETELPCLAPSCCYVFLDIMKAIPEHILTYYYCALLHIQLEQYENACIFLEKCLVLDSDFWPARTELLQIEIENQKLSPVFHNQLEFFLQKARLLKKFQCSHCGFKQKNIFFICPKCRSWYTISFRSKFSD